MQLIKVNLMRMPAMMIVETLRCSKNGGEKKYGVYNGYILTVN